MLKKVQLRRGVRWCAWAALMFLPATNVQAQCQYTVSAVIEGPEICGVFGRANVVPSAINDHGVVTGTYSCPGGFGRPFMWSEKTGFVAIPLPPGVSHATPSDINNKNEIVGTANTNAAGGARGFLLNGDGQWTLFTPLNGDPANQSAAFTINDATEVMGTRSGLGFHWYDGVFTDIPSPIEGTVWGFDINNTLGHATGQISFGHAFLWNGRVLHDLGTILGGTSAAARGIDESDTIVGGATVSDRNGLPEGHGFILTDRQLIDLGVPEPFDHSSARDINEAGQVLVTTSSLFNGHSNYVWQNGILTELPQLFEQPDPNIVLGEIRGSNNRGQICARANQQVIGGFSVGVVLSPVESPLGDVNLDCTVDELDLTAVLGDWGPCADRVTCLCDIVTSATFLPPGDGVVDGADLAVVLGSWSNSTPADAYPRP